MTHKGACGVCCRRSVTAPVPASRGQAGWRGTRTIGCPASGAGTGPWAHTGQQRGRISAEIHGERPGRTPEKMLVNRGGDPERDDYPLPPVDIEIPDDARELERDVQDYHRELRAQRRHRLARRLAGSITRDGMVLPLLASCLALTLLAGTLLTMFTARRVVPPATQTTSEPQTATATAPPTVGQPGPP